MNRFRITLIAGFTTILITISLGQDLAAILANAREEMSAGNFDTAKEQLEAILEQTPAYAPAYFELSKIALIQDDLIGAQDNIKAAIDHDPRNEEYRAEAEKIAELSSAMSSASRLIDDRDYMGAVAHYEKVLEDYPTFATAYYMMGIAFTRDDQPHQAAKAFRQAMAYNPDDARYNQALRRIVADKYNEANRLYNARDWEAAAATYQEAYRLDPGFHQAYYRLSRSYQNMGEIDSALITLDRAIEIKPDYITAIVEKGDILRREGRLSEAEAIYRQGISIDETTDEAWLGLGAVLRREKPLEAIEAFKSTLAVNPKSGDAAEYLGELYSEQEKWADAQRYLELAVKLKPQNHTPAWRLSHVYNTLGEHEKARQMAKRSTSLRKTFEYGWYELGIAEKALGNRVAAIEAFRNALKGRDAGIRRSAQYELKQLEATSR